MRSRFLKRLLPVGLLVLAAGFATRAKAGSIVLDGGFEIPAVSDGYNGALGDGWFATQNNIAIAASGGFEASHSGNQMAYLDDGFEQMNTLSQTLTTMSGQAYLVSFWVADSAPNPLTVDFGSQVLFNGTAPTDGVAVASDYVNDSYIVTATSTNTILSFTGEFTSGVGTLLDDVSVTAVSGVPEPATLAFTALGFLTLFALRSIYDKLQVYSKSEAVAKALRNRLV
jgi:hypothetical protein